MFSQSITTIRIKPAPERRRFRRLTDAKELPENDCRFYCHEACHNAENGAQWCYYVPDNCPFLNIEASDAASA